MLPAILFGALFIAQASPAALLQHRQEVLAAKTYKTADGRTMPYRLFVPEKDKTTTKYPLVVFLHGGGGSGQDNIKQIDGGNGYLIDLLTNRENQSKFPSFVVAPQALQQEGWIEYDSITPTRRLQMVLELIGELQKSYSIDRNRLYVLGQSMGGLGTFAIITMQPTMFAAAVSVCGGGDESKAARIARVPLWAFHGDRDESVSVERSRKMIAAMTKNGGHPKYTEYKGEGHLIWSKVVSEPDLLPWLFAQKRE